MILTQCCNLTSENRTVAETVTAVLIYEAKKYNVSIIVSSVKFIYYFKPSIS